MEVIRKYDPLIVTPENKGVYQLPVRNSAGKVVDISGYTEVYRRQDKREQCTVSNYYFHLHDDKIVVVGDDQTPYNDWNDFLTKKFPVDKYLADDDDLVTWGHYGRNYRFRLNSNGTLKLVSQSGSDEFKHRCTPVVEQLERYRDIIKVYSDRGDLVILLSNGFLHYWHCETCDIMDLHEYDVADLIIFQQQVVVHTKQGKIIYDPHKLPSTALRSLTFEAIRREKIFGGHFFSPSEEIVDFRSFSHVGQSFDLIYGFNEDGRVQIFSFGGSIKQLTLPFSLKTMLYPSFYSSVGYYVSSDGSSYEYNYHLKELKGIKKLQAVIRGGFCTESGDFYKAEDEKVLSYKYSTVPVRTGIKQVYQCEMYYAFLY